MSVATYIVVALAFAISNMVLFRRCAEPFPIRLSKGLWVTFVVAAIQTLLYIIGLAVGDLLRIESTSDANMFARANAYIMLGFLVFVILKQLFPYLRREPQLPIFNITEWKSVAAMAFATGINLLLAGIGIGFVMPFDGHLHIVLWPLLALSFVFGYIGVMFGRQKVTMRPRRWIIVSDILLLGTAIAAVVNV